MAARTTYILANPLSGGRNHGATLRALESAAKKHSGVTFAAIDFTRLDEQLAAARGAEIIIIGGGDGTVSSIISRLGETSAAIGVLPLGTGNDLAREFGLHTMKEPEATLAFYQSAASRPFHIGRLEWGENFSRYADFVNYVSFGFDAKVVADFARWREQKFFQFFKSLGVLMNRAAYAAASLKHIGYRLGPPTQIFNEDIKSLLMAPRGMSIIFPNIRSMMGSGKSNIHGSGFDRRVEAVVPQNPLAYVKMLSNYRAPFLPEPQFLGSSEAWTISALPAGCLTQIDGEARPDICATQFRVRIARTVNVITALPPEVTPS